MQPPYSLTAVGIGAILALCPIETAVAQTARSVSLPAWSESSPPETVVAQQIQWSHHTAIAARAIAPKSLPKLQQISVAASQLAVQSAASIQIADAAPSAAANASSSAAPASEAIAPNANPGTISPAAASVETPAATPSNSDPAAGDQVAPVRTTPTPESAATPESAPAPENAATPGNAATPENAPTGTEPSPTVPPIGTEANPTPATGDEASPPPPDYLDPNPNPLLFPTQPVEVNVVGTQPITLRQALELAQRNSPQLRQGQQELDRTRAALRQAQAANLPTLDLTTSLTQQQAQSVGQTATLTGGITESTVTNDSTTLNGQLQVSYDLFTAGSRSATIRANEQQVRFQELQLEITAEDLRRSVTRAYYDLQDADEQVRISQATVAESQRSLQDAQALESAGVGTRFDVLQAQVQLANDQQDFTQRISTQRINRRQIVQLLNLSQVVDVSAAEPVAVADLWNLSLDQSVVLAYRNRAELEQQLVQRDISDQQRQAALAANGPQVSLVANYNAQNQLDTSNGFLRGYSFGAQFNWRLFDGGAARAAADQQEANISIAESQFENLRTQVRFQVEQAYLNLQANFDNIQTASLAQQEAGEALRLARLRFQAGVGIQSDVLRAQTQLTQAEVNRVEAILGYNRSLADLQRAVSNFPDSNLADSP